MKQRCPVCGRRLDGYAGRGRPPVYDSDACRELDRALIEAGRQAARVAARIDETHGDEVCEQARDGLAARVRSLLAVLGVEAPEFELAANVVGETVPCVVGRRE